MRKKYFIAALILAFLLPSCGGGEEYRKTREIMGTYVTITVARGELPEMVVRGAVRDAFEEIERVDRLMSTYKPESQLSEINRLAGIAPVKVDPEVLETVRDALDVARRTDGAFDPTVGPLIRLWKIGSEEARLPTSAEIEKAKELVDYRQVVVDEPASTVYIKKKGMALDLGGIAKGYASDLAVSLLRKRGLTGGIVAVAGDIKFFGTRDGGRPWKAGIQHPRREGGLLARLEPGDAAMSTSGDYERYFMKDGVRYHHIIDPATGLPARGLISVTVLSKESYLADGLSTALFVMGPVRALAFARAHPEVEALMVTSEGRVLATGRFSGMDIEAVEADN
ncbi:MAG: FAD:protein FMN transferase [Nitrospirae bacterium]|nr:FAD:protein FMN transferase [Nitrospirota bacterium]